MKLYIGINENEKYMKITNDRDCLSPAITKLAVETWDERSSYMMKQRVDGLKHFYEQMLYKVDVEI